MRVVTLRGRASFSDHCVRGSVVILFFKGRSEDIMYLFFYFLDTLFLYMRSCDHFMDIHCTYFLLYIDDVCFSLTYPFMCCFFSLFIHMLLIIFMQSIISISHKDALMSFV